MQIFSTLSLPLVSALLSAVACGITGTLTLLRRGTYAAGAISHACFAGIGLARYLSVCCAVSWFSTDLGALLCALVAALFLSLHPAAASGKSDSALSALWAVGMAIGLGFMHLAKANAENLEEDLFGSLLAINAGDIVLLGVLDVVLIAAFALFYRGIISVTISRKATQLRGAPAWLYSSVLALMTALTVVMLVHTVGILLVVALLTFPALAARHFSRRIVAMMCLSATIAFVCIAGGLLLSGFINMPASVSIVFLSAVVSLVAFATHRLLRRIRARHLAHSEVCVEN